MNKVYVVTTVHPANDVRIYHREILSLIKKYRVIYLAPNSLEEKRDNLELAKIAANGGRVSRSFAYFRYLKRQGAKTIHFHDIDFAPFAIILKYFFGAKIIFDKHEFYYLTIENRGWAPDWLKPVLRIVLLGAERFFSLFCDGLVVANPRQLDHDKNATLLLNVPPLDNYASFNSKKDYKKVCYIGDVTVSRGANKIIEIAKILPAGYEVNIVGRVRDESIEKKMREVGIVIHGYISNNKIMSLLKDIGIGLVPFEERDQYKKSVPSKIFDYLAMGMNVVAADFVRDSLTNEMNFGQGVIFVENSPDKMKEAITKLSNEKNASFWSAENRAYFENNFNWGTQEKKMFALYENIIGGVGE